MVSWRTVAIVAVVAIAFIAGTRVFGNWRKSGLEEESGPQLANPSNAAGGKPGAPGSVTFRVRVPDVTPAADTIVLHVGLATFPMTRLPDGRLETTVDLSLWERETRLVYGYSRGGFHPYAEVGFNEDVKKLPRVHSIGSASVVEDVVESWKWLPNAPAEPAINSSFSTASIASRERFWGGPHLADWWDPTFAWQLNSTAAKMEDMRYAWVAISPSWDMKSVDPPVLCAECTEMPTFSDEELRAQIRWLKSEGLSVLLRAQTCCTVEDAATRNATWWNAYYDQYEAMVRYHAKVAREEGADAFMFTSAHFALPGEAGAPPFAHDRWQRIVDAAEESGVPISYETYGFGDERPWPWTAIDFFDRLDYLAINFGPALSGSRAPTQAELDLNMSKEWAGIDRVHNETGLPVVLHAVHYESIAGGATPVPEHFDTFYDPAEAKFVYDGAVQAMCYESVLREVAKRPWVEGVFSWGYGYHDGRTPDGTLRGKPAEAVFAGWMNALEASVVSG